MKLDSIFKSLEDLRYGQDIEASDELLIKVMNNGTLNNLRNLCSLLDNNVKEPCQDEAIIQVIFYFLDKYGIYEGLCELVKNYRIINLRGDSWLYKINLECIQNSVYKECYLNIVKGSSEDIKQLVALNTKKILKYNPEHANKIGEVLSCIGHGEIISKKVKNSFRISIKDEIISQDKRKDESFNRVYIN